MTSTMYLDSHMPYILVGCLHNCPLELKGEIQGKSVFVEPNMGLLWACSLQQARRIDHVAPELVM